MSGRRSGDCRAAGAREGNTGMNVLSAQWESLVGAGVLDQAGFAQQDCCLHTEQGTGKVIASAQVHHPAMWLQEGWSTRQEERG